MHKFCCYPEHIYIHFPFCKNKCFYCDFVSFQNHKEYINQYHQALKKEILFFAKSIQNKKHKKIKTIFLGGGSPSLYPLELLKELFNILNDNFDLSTMQEVTIEVNPANVTEKKIAVWSELGINRLSIGVQVLNDKILKNLNRFQSAQDVQNCFDLAQKYFKNISADLILGLPGTTKDIWFSTLNQIISYSITHISIYLLMVYPKTPLFFKLKNKDLNILEEQTIINLYQQTVELLQKKQFEQYEISNFAKPGYESRHNIAYWDLKPYIGFGLSASSYDGVSRFTNQNNLSRYLGVQDYIDNNKEYYTNEILTDEQRFLEQLMLGLRQAKGADLHSMLYFLSGAKKEKFLKSLKKLELQGLLHYQGGRIALTIKGFLLENEVILWLLRS